MNTKQGKQITNEAMKEEDAPKQISNSTIPHQL
jgi:hypothetical protein